MNKINPRPTDAEFRRLWDRFSQSTLDELTACPKTGLASCLLEMNTTFGFKATRIYLSKSALQEITHLESELRNIFERWIKYLIR